MQISPKSEGLPIVLAMALVFWAGSAMAQERRCNELGAACSCAESMDTATYTHATAPDNCAGPTEEALDPDNANTKECDHIRVTDFIGPCTGRVSAQTETGMPAGNSVSKVFRWNAGWGSFSVQGNHTLKPTTKRVCYRHYIRMSPDYDGGNFATDSTSENCDAGKFVQMSSDNGIDNQMGSGGSRGRNKQLVWWHRWPQSNGGVNQPSSGSFAYADCYGQWCRMEVCVSGDFAGGTGNFFSEAYVTRLSDGKRMDWPRYNLGGGNPGLNPWRDEIVHAFRGSPTEPGTCGNGFPGTLTNEWREMSYLAKAEWTTDVPGTFIGPAYEVEAGGGSPSVPGEEPPPIPDPDPPPPSSPAPPPQTGSLVFVSSGVLSGNAATVTATVTGGVGPYQFLFDCGNVGVWHGIINTSSAIAQFACPWSGQSSIQVRTWVWDQTTNAVGEQIVQVSATAPSSTLGKPGTPTLTNP